MVVDGLGTRSTSMRAALEALNSTQVSVVGVITNKLKRVRFGYGYAYPDYYYYDQYYYRYYASADTDGATVDGAGPLYKRPAHWVRSAISRFQPNRRS